MGAAEDKAMSIILTEAERLNQWSATQFAFKLPRRLDWIFARIEVTPPMIQCRKEIENISELAIECLSGPDTDLSQATLLRLELCATIRRPMRELRGAFRADGRMRRISLNSRLIESVAYNSETASLSVWLQSRRRAIHEDVSHAEYMNLISADSPGFYYTYFIASKDMSKPTRLGWLVQLLSELRSTVRYYWR